MIRDSKFPHESICIIDLGLEYYIGRLHDLLTAEGPDEIRICLCISLRDLSQLRIQGLTCARSSYVYPACFVSPACRTGIVAEVGSPRRHTYTEQT